VQSQVTPRDWRIFQELPGDHRPGPEVARELGMTVTAILTAECRVQKRLRAEIRRLEGVDPLGAGPI
jgi:hypothetical protein